MYKTRRAYTSMDDYRRGYAMDDWGPARQVKFLPLNKNVTSVCTQTHQGDVPLPSSPVPAVQDKSTNTNDMGDQTLTHGLGTGVPLHHSYNPAVDRVEPYADTEAVAASYDTGMRVPANNFYQRLLRRDTTDLNMLANRRLANDLYEDPGPPIFRSGRLGAPWRHIRQCTGNLGNHICFVDGVVKQQDMKKAPPFGVTTSRDLREYSYVPVVSYKKVPRLKPTPEDRYFNQYNDHARKGFKYWYDDMKNKPIKFGPTQTIGGRMMKLGVGF